MDDRFKNVKLGTNKPDVEKKELSAIERAREALKDDMLAYKYGLEKGRAEALNDALHILANAIQKALTKAED
jgi:hypothetical protein